MKVKEEEIRPQSIFDEYLRLAAKDSVDFFENVKFEEILCPVCSCEGKIAFSKLNFSYSECGECKSIYVNPRPIKRAFDLYYKDSPSTKFWASTFYKSTEKARREKLWKPKAKLVKDIINKYSNEKNQIESIIDIGGGYGVFIEEFLKIKKINSLIVEPSIHLSAICRSKGINVLEKFIEEVKINDLPTTKSCYVSFELFEHVHDPYDFLKSIYVKMKKGDLFIFTTLSGMGIDIQILRENSKSVFPPHHLNFLNPKSITKLLTKVGFNVLEASTPGKLDIDILSKNKKNINNKFWLNFLDYSNDEEKEKMQNFISESGLSSHMMITCIK